VSGRSYRCSYIPTPSLMNPQKMRIRGRITLPFGVSFFLVSPFGYDSICRIFLGAYLISLGQAWAEDKGELATCRQRADKRRAAIA